MKAIAIAVENAVHEQQAPTPTAAESVAVKIAELQAERATLATNHERDDSIVRHYRRQVATADAQIESALLGEREAQRALIQGLTRVKALMLAHADVTPGQATVDAAQTALSEAQDHLSEVRALRATFATKLAEAEAASAQSAAALQEANALITELEAFRKEQHEHAASLALQESLAEYGRLATHALAALQALDAFDQAARARLEPYRRTTDFARKTVSAVTLLDVSGITSDAWANAQLVGLGPQSRVARALDTSLVRATRHELQRVSDRLDATRQEKHTA